MTPRSRKDKGKRLQNLVVKMVLAVFPDLTARDVLSRIMGDSGSDVILSEVAFKAFPYDVECKSNARFAIYQAYEQRNEDVIDGERLVVIKGNHKPPLAIVSLDHFMELIDASNNTTNTL